MPSIFTRILAGEIPGQFVFRDERWVGLLDIAPAAPGHLLLIPRHEAPLIAQLDAATLADLGPLLARATRCLTTTLNANGVSVLLRDGAAAGQEVPHVHVHLIPRRLGEANQRFSGERAAPADLAAMAERLKTVW